MAEGPGPQRRVARTTAASRSRNIGRTLSPPSASSSPSSASMCFFLLLSQAFAMAILRCAD